MDGFSFFIFIIVTIITFVDWLLDDIQRNELREKIADWYVFLADTSFEQLLAKTSVTIRKNIEKVFGVNWLSLRFIALSFILAIASAIILTVLIRQYVVGNDSVEDFLIIGSFFLIASSSLATWTSLSLLVRMFKVMEQHPSLHYLLFIIFIDILAVIFSILLIGVIAYGILYLLLLKPVGAVVLFIFFTPELIASCITSLLPIFIHIIISIFFIFSKLAFPILKPPVTLILLRVNESKKGVFSLLAIGIGAIAKTTQEIIKYLSSSEKGYGLFLPIIIIGVYLIVVSIFGRFLPLRTTIKSISQRASLGLAGIIIVTFFFPKVFHDVNTTEQINNKISESHALVQENKHVDIFILGHIDHGKTTLISAIKKVASKEELENKTLYNEMDHPHEQQFNGFSIAMKKVEYQSQTHDYSFFDFKGHSDVIKGLVIGNAVGLRAPDSAILVVGMDDGPMPQTLEHLYFLQQVGIRKIVVYMNKADMVDDHELKSLVTEEVKELLVKYGFSKDDTPMISGSALKALEGDKSNLGEPAILRLLNEIDHHVQRVEQPFLMQIDDIVSLSNNDAEVTGIVRRGNLLIGDKVNIIGTESIINGRVGKINIVKEGNVKRKATLTLIGIDQAYIARGKIISKFDSIKYYKSFDALAILVPPTKETDRPIIEGDNESFHFWNEDISGKISFKKDGNGRREMWMFEDDALITVNLENSAAIGIGMHFSIRRKNRVIGMGIITNLLE